MTILLIVCLYFNCVHMVKPILIQFDTYIIQVFVVTLAYIISCLDLMPTFYFNFTKIQDVMPICLTFFSWVAMITGKMKIH